MDYQPLQQHSRDLLLDKFLIFRIEEQIQHNIREEVRVAIRIAQLIGHCVQQHIATLRVQRVQQLLVNIHGRRVLDRHLILYLDDGQAAHIDDN